MKTEKEIKKEIDELHLRINRRKSEIREAEKENEEDVIRMETLKWSLVTTSVHVCDTPFVSKENTKTLIVPRGATNDDIEKFLEKQVSSFAGDGPVPDDEDEFIPAPKKKKRIALTDDEEDKQYNDMFV
jgi:hypothetical protein